MATVVAQTDKGLLLVEHAVGSLRARKVALPGITVIERACAQALTRANRGIYVTLGEQLTVDGRKRLDGLLRRPDSFLAEIGWLRQAPLCPNARAMREHIDRLTAWRDLDLPWASGKLVHRNRVLKLAREGASMTAADLARFEPNRRHATLFAIFGSYVERSKTPYEHRWEIAQAYGYRRLSVPGTAAEFRSFLTARAWTRAGRPTQLFYQGVAWLRAERVLLPGVSLANTLTPGALTGTYNPTGEGKFFFVIMAAFAELERDMIHERTMVGLAAARAQGRTGGSPTVMDDDTLAAARARHANGESPTQIAKALGVSRASIYRHLPTSNPRTVPPGQNP